jgi:hypothetical protein
VASARLAPAPLAQLHDGRARRALRLRVRRIHGARTLPQAPRRRDGPQRNRRQALTRQG